MSFEGAPSRVPRLMQGESEDRPGTPPSGLWDKVKGLYNAGNDQADIRNKLDEIKEKIAEALEYFINLIIIFTFETIIAPLLGLWMIILLGRFALSRIGNVL